MKPTCLLLKRLSLPGQALGSALMRGDQLAAMVRPELRDLIEMRLSAFHAGLMPTAVLSRMAAGLARGSVVIFVKTAARGVTQKQIDVLRNHGLSVGLDVIDMALADIVTAHFDFFIAASVTGQRALQEHLRNEGQKKPVYLVHHHADPRLPGRDIPSDRAFSCAFLGLTENAFIPPALAGQIEVFHVKTSRDFEKSLPQLARIPLHYAVRPTATHASGQSYKPFTKGFTAAACGAAILVNRDADDAEALLGADYPFFVDAPTDAAIKTVFDAASAAFGGPIWQEALSRVDSLKAVSAPQAVADQMRALITNVQKQSN